MLTTEIINMHLHEIKEIGSWEKSDYPVSHYKKVYVQRVIGGWNYIYENLGVVFVPNSYNTYKERKMVE